MALTTHFCADRTPSKGDDDDGEEGDKEDDDKDVTEEEEEASESLFDGLNLDRDETDEDEQMPDVEEEEEDDKRDDNSNDADEEESRAEEEIESKSAKPNKKAKMSTITQASTPPAIPTSLLSTPSAARRFHDLYMAQMTQAFGSDLDKIRQEEGFDENRLSILIDSLEAGIDIFTDMEKELMVASEEGTQ
ncbi:hypothetical protein BC937DRAFT_91584 [Endogone sp. FLAS-F59071]|nr:hypothetical protein BC937DRAFT_91584 [Endogone sp. FLAS-F59071]|eukprot:RUS16136.1 hypothetical protein BC937DRAFT_91584 [Endogone sp. FLAS-F59071]